MQHSGLYGGDSVKIYKGRLSGLVFEADLVKNGFERRIRRSSTVFGYLLFIPVSALLLGLKGVLCRKTNVLTGEIGVMNLLLLVLLFYLYR